MPEPVKVHRSRLGTALAVAGIALGVVAAAMAAQQFMAADNGATSAFGQMALPTVGVALALILGAIVVQARSRRPQA